VRYIHLNPVRGKVVGSLEELKKSRWTGHGILLGEYSGAWQNTDEILSRFSSERKIARQKYEAFVAEGKRLEKNVNLSGGGLIRSMGRIRKVLCTGTSRKLRDISRGLSGSVTS